MAKRKKVGKFYIETIVREHFDTEAERAEYIKKLPQATYDEKKSLLEDGHIEEERKDKAIFVTMTTKEVI